MNRRTLLAAAVATTALAGCLDATSETDGAPSAASEDDDPEPTDRTEPEGDEYTECSAPFVEYDELPEALRVEVDAALDDGSYEADDLLYDRAVSDHTPLWTGSELYDHEVTRTGETLRLEFERRTEFESPRDVTVSNETDDARSVTVTVSDGNGNRYVDETISIAPTERKQLSGVTAFGEYEVDVELDDGRRETASWEVPPPHGIVVEGVTVSITDEKLAVRTNALAYDYVPCSSQWSRL